MATERIRIGFMGAGNNTRRRHIPGTDGVARSAASGQSVPVAGF